MHFWQLKTFWYETKVRLCLTGFHSVRLTCRYVWTILTVTHIKKFQPYLLSNSMIQRTLLFALSRRRWCDLRKRCDVSLVVTFLCKLYRQFERVQSLPEDQHDVSTFWLRKTRKPVLGVLLVQKPGKPPKLYRGTNMEVRFVDRYVCV